DLAAQESQDVGSMTACREEGAPPALFGDIRGITRVDFLERVPVVGFAIDEIAKHAIFDQLPHRLELWVPAQHKAGNGLYTGFGDSIADLRGFLGREADRLLDDDMPASLRGPDAVLGPQMRVGTGDDDVDAVVPVQIVE